LGYAVFVDDGNQGDFTEVNQDLDPLVRDDPGRHELTITSPFTDPSAVGLTFRIKVLCYNIEGSTFSDIASIILADVPTAPQNLPRKIQ
jgi:hypothetical protein